MRIAAREPATSSLQLRRVDLRQVGVRERVRVELPAGGEELADPRRADPPHRLEVAHLEVEDARPVARLQDRQRVPHLAQVAVVEGEDDRLRRQLRRAAPGVEDPLQRDRVVAVRGQPRDLAGEVRARDIQLRVGRVRRVPW